MNAKNLFFERRRKSDCLGTGFTFARASDLVGYAVSANKRGSYLSSDVC